MPAPTPPPALRVAHLTKRYGAQLILDNLSFEVAEGETLVLPGPSGGKTTLLKTLNRLIEPDDGTIAVNGRDVRQQVPEASPTRYVRGTSQVDWRNSAEPYQG